MAIPGKKLAAFASKGGGPQKQPDAPPNPKKGDKGGKPGKPGKPNDDHQEGGEGKFGKLIPLLEEHCRDLEDMAEELDPEALTDHESELSKPDHDMLLDSMKGLDEGLQDELHASIGGIEYDQAMKLAAHLGDEGMVEDEDAFAGLLFRIGEVLKTGEDDEEKDDEEPPPSSKKPKDEEEGDEEDEDEEGE